MGTSILDEFRDEMKVDFDFKSTDAKDDLLSEIKCYEKTIKYLTAIRIADRNEMNRFLKFLLTKKINIKSIIKKHRNIHDVIDSICEVFIDEYLSLYPNSYSIFNTINDSEFFEWCRNNIEGFQGGEIEQAPQYWCSIKE